MIEERGGKRTRVRATTRIRKGSWERYTQVGHCTGARSGRSLCQALAVQLQRVAFAQPRAVTRPTVRTAPRMRSPLLLSLLSSCSSCASSSFSYSLSALSPTFPTILSLPPTSFPIFASRTFLGTGKQKRVYLTRPKGEGEERTHLLPSLFFYPILTVPHKAHAKCEMRLTSRYLVTILGAFNLET